MQNAITDNIADALAKMLRNKKKKELLYRNARCIAVVMLIAQCFVQ